MLKKLLTGTVVLISAIIAGVSVHKQYATSPDYATPTTQVITGKVIRVADGDTLTILDASNRQTKIRLYGVDAPESAQDFGNKSREKLASLVAGKNIAVTVVDVDQYGRSVSRINVDGKEVAEEMLQAGMVWLYTSYCQIPECKYWKTLETRARKAKVGLWANPSAQKPWKWRQAHR